MNAPKSRKNVVVDHCFEVLKSTIEKETKDNTFIFTNLIFNTFLFCIIREIYLDGSIGNKIYMDERITKYLAQIGKSTPDNVITLLTTLLKSYELYEDIEKLMESYDELITQYQRMIQDAAGS